MFYSISIPEKKIEGEIPLTASKSISNRLLMIQAISGKKFMIDNLASAGDTVLLKKILSANENTIDAENSGTVFRFLTAYLSQQPGEWILTGSSQMQQRPVGPLVLALQNLGADISYISKKNYPPLKINGKKLRGGKINIDGSISSQFISALLLIAP